MAIRIDRVYTRTGDAGETALVAGVRVPKDHPRIEAFGTVDELNCAVGLAAEETRALPAGAAALREELEPLLVDVQRKLFDLGAYLATPPDRFKEGMPAVEATDVSSLEARMDDWEKSLEPLRSFILPGGGRLGALFHLCRAVCRRAEREAVRLGRTEPFAKPVVPYLNRLSDWLFVAARHAAQALGEPEPLWRPPAAKT